jgi:hypothetical protein
MGQFNAGTYEILSHDGRQVHAGLFKTADKIFDFVRGQVAGIYTVFKELPPEHGARESEHWGYVINDGAGKVTYHATLPGA